MSTHCRAAAAIVIRTWLDRDRSGIQPRVSTLRDCIADVELQLAGFIAALQSSRLAQIRGSSSLSLK
ncbi:MAG: hypothetical protein V7752_07635 [Halopseudomonas sp.]